MGMAKIPDTSTSEPTNHPGKPTIEAAPQDSALLKCEECGGTQRVWLNQSGYSCAEVADVALEKFREAIESDDCGYRIPVKEGWVDE